MICATARTPKRSRPPSGCWTGSKKSAAEPRRLHLVDVDECEIHTHPTLAKVWRRRGQPMRIPAAGDDHKCAIFGGLDSASGRIIHQINPRKDEGAFMAFLDALAHAFPADEPLVVVLDNASSHQSYAVQEWWRAHTDQFQPFFLPAYSPQLNRIERLWRYLAVSEGEARLPSLVQRSDTSAAGGRDAAHRAPSPLPCRRWAGVPTTPQLSRNRLETVKDLRLMGW